MKCELYNDNFENAKSYNIPTKAQLIIADIPYNIGTDFYGSNPMWYKGGDNKNGESKFAGKSAFNTDFSFNIKNFFDFCTRMLKKDDEEKQEKRGKSSNSPCMIVFCAFEQLNTVIEQAKLKGFKNYIPLVFIKNFSPQVLKANMRIVGATEYALVLYRNRLPKFNNFDANGVNHMVFNWFLWEKDGTNIPKVHPTQKPVKVLKKIISIFTDEGDTVIDPCAGSGSTLRACLELNRNCYGFEVGKEQYKKTMASGMLDYKPEIKIEIPKDNVVGMKEMSIFDMLLLKNA